MLTYLGVGERRYGEKPVPQYGRPSWEFQAALSGAIAPTLPGHPFSGGEMRKASLWAFPPGHVHGWTARRGEVARIAVFHFESIPEPAATFIRRRGSVEAPLSEDELVRVDELSAELAALKDGDDPLALLKFERAAVELAIVALEALPEGETAGLVDRAAFVSASALAWYSEHLSEGPGLSEVAAAVSCSPSHLRRLFVAARGASPQEAFEELRLSRARDMLRSGSASMKEIAAACGYGSPSSFSRAFARASGISPIEMREKGDGYSPREGAFHYAEGQGDLSNKNT